MPDTITFRTDEISSRALEVLTRDGTAVSAAVRDALVRAAQQFEAERLREEALALAGDAADRAEALRVLQDTGALRAG